MTSRNLNFDPFSGVNNKGILLKSHNSTYVNDYALPSFFLLFRGPVLEKKVSDFTLSQVASHPQRNTITLPVISQDFLIAARKCDSLPPFLPFTCCQLFILITFPGNLC